MNSALLAPPSNSLESIERHLSDVSDDLLRPLTSANELSPDRRRSIIARYSAVLEGNFIYWMTGAYLAAQSEEAKALIRQNLIEEIRDCHPGMLRRFTLAAKAFPTAPDAEAVLPRLHAFRLFVGKMDAVPLVTAMAFFEGWIQRFMPYLEDLAVEQGSSEKEYTQVHGVCDIAHSKELFQALQSELQVSGRAYQPEELYEGVDKLRALIQCVMAV